MRRRSLTLIKAHAAVGAIDGASVEMIMTTASELSPKFRHIRLILARERGHPAGSPEEGYDVLAPLDSDGRFDPVEWKRDQSLCRVRHFRPNEEDRIGLLKRRPGGQWYIDYEVGADDDEPGFRLGEERFVTGEYVGLGPCEKLHAFQVVRVERP